MSATNERNLTQKGAHGECKNQSSVSQIKNEAIEKFAYIYCFLLLHVIHFSVRLHEIWQISFYVILLTNRQIALKTHPPP